MGSYSSRLTISKCLRHKSPKDKAVFQLIRNFILSTCALGMPPPYIKSSRKSKVVPARNTERKLKFHWFRKFSTPSKFHNDVNSQQRPEFVEIAWNYLPMNEFLFEPVAKLVYPPNTRVFVTNWPSFVLKTGDIYSKSRNLAQNYFFDVSSRWRCFKSSPKLDWGIKHLRMM